MFSFSFLGLSAKSSNSHKILFNLLNLNPIPLVMFYAVSPEQYTSISVNLYSSLITASGRS